MSLFLENGHRISEEINRLTKLSRTFSEFSQRSAYSKTVIDDFLNYNTTVISGVIQSPSSYLGIVF